VRYRHRVLTLLATLSVITYLDRVCISVAGPRMQEALHIGPLAWGWVTRVADIRLLGAAIRKLQRAVHSDGRAASDRRLAVDQG